MAKLEDIPFISVGESMCSKAWKGKNPNGIWTESYLLLEIMFLFVALKVNFTYNAVEKKTFQKKMKY